MVCKYKNKEQESTCQRPSKYLIGWEHDGVVDWIPVCGHHDNAVGVQNLMTAYGLSYQDARKMNAEFTKAGP